MIALAKYVFSLSALAAYGVLYAESEEGEHAICSISLATPFLVVASLNFIIGDFIASRKCSRAAYKWLSALAMICIGGEVAYIACHFGIVYRNATWGWIPCHLINIAYSYYIYTYLKHSESNNGL